MGIEGGNSSDAGLSSNGKTYRKISLLKETIIALLAVCLFVSLVNPGLHPVKAGSIPPGIVYSIPIKLTNQQPIATPVPFQQMIRVNSADYSSHEAPDLQNIEFFDSNGVVIPSWLESGNNNTSTDTVYWLKLAGGIPAGSSVIVYMGFGSPNINLFNTGTTGEAPQLSSIYGQYDNGANVFSVYDNFAGNSLNTNTWVVDSGSTSGFINNGFKADTSASLKIHTSYAFPGSQGVLDFWGNQSGLAPVPNNYPDIGFSMIAQSTTNHGGLGYFAYCPVDTPGAS